MNNQSSVAIDGDDPVTFSELWSMTDAFAGGLRDRGISPDDAVAIRLSTPRAVLVAVYGALRNGSVPVTIPPDVDNRTIRAILNEVDARAYVTDETPFLPIINRSEAVQVVITVDCDARMGIALERLLENSSLNLAGGRTGVDVARRADRDRALLAYGTGSDGDPLGVEYTHETLAAAGDVGESLLGSATDGSSVPDSRTPDGGAVRHLGSRSLSDPLELLYGATAAIFGGGRYVPVDDWTPETARSLLATGAADRTFLAPAQYDAVRSLGATDADVTDAVVVERTAAPLEERVDAGEAIRVRGRPETGLTHVRTPADVEAGRLGETLPGVEARTRSEIDTRTLEDDTVPERGDTLVVDGPGTMERYVDRPDATADRFVSVEGRRWVRTGVTVSRTDPESKTSTGGDNFDGDDSFDRSRPGVVCVTDPMETVRDGV
ncbi:AMP-dependent synthetase and ligase [Natronolimnohabitans innermongolicus JCM 12255]|uniref:AMP-dependent synthetase and ligase n=2 Tax=Natronolimnohabitans innermongolicus TaxID=253107 RepID=L9XNG7_9EURY|nr:AMP-dependent synthetase and ligase [Natronolimnohabitans innermongolicus JCM 12255]